MSNSREKWPKQLGINKRPKAHRIDEIVRELRETLSDEMARKAYCIRYNRDPSPSELTQFKDDLVTEHYDLGFSSWVENCLFDPRAVSSRSISETLAKPGPAYFVANLSRGARKRYEVQLLDEIGQASSTATFYSADEEIVLESAPVDRRVLLAAMAQPEGKGTYVDELGDPVSPF